MTGAGKVRCRNCQAHNDDHQIATSKEPDPILEAREISAEEDQHLVVKVMAEQEILVTGSAKVH